MIELTIGIPLLNEEESISKCLGSILESDLPREYEIIVCDNGSTDKSPELLKRFRNKRLRIIDEQNKGKAFAINRILEQAKSNYVIFCDADIIVKKDTLKKIYKKLRDSDLEVVGSEFEDISKNILFRNYYKNLSKIMKDDIDENVYGMCFGVKKKGFKKIPSVLSTDFFISAYYYFGNQKAIRDKSIKAYYKKPNSFRDILMKKTRNRLKYLQIKKTFPELSKFPYEPKIDFRKLLRNISFAVFLTFLIHSLIEVLAFVFGTIIFYISFKNIGYSWRKAKSTTLKE